MLPLNCPVCKQRAIAYDKDYVYCTSCSFYRRPLRWFQKPIAWASDRVLWAWRIPIIAWFIFTLFQHWRNSSLSLNRLNNPLNALNFGIHELGHFLFSFFGEFMHILGGSLFQCLFPILWMVGFLQKRWYFAAAMCWCWLGMNLFDVATYAADARARLLPLATGLAGLYEQGNDDFYDKAHDWYQILSRTNALESDLAIASGLRVAASIAFIVGIILGILLIARMAQVSIKKRSASSNGEAAE